MKKADGTIIATPKELEDYLDELSTQSITHKITWTDKFSTEWDLPCMSDTHVLMCHWMLYKDWKMYLAAEIMLSELRRRTMGTHLSNFENLINKYKQKPETWRLKIYT